MASEQINVSVAALEEKIAALRKLKTDCEALDTSEDALVGSGQSIAVYQAIDQEYALIQKSILTLLDNSVQFFENVKKTMEEADRQASEKIAQNAAAGLVQGAIAASKVEVSVR